MFVVFPVVKIYAPSQGGFRAFAVFQLFYLLCEMRQLFVQTQLQFCSPLPVSLYFPTPDKLEKKKKIVHNSAGDDKCCSMKSIKK